MAIEPKEISIHSQFSKLNLAAKVWGADTNSYKVLGLHGWMDNAATFDKIGPALAESNIQLVSLDLPGHGMSDHRPPGPSMHFIDYVSDVVSVLDVLEWKECYLLGHSMGGALTSMVASLIPERIIRAIAIEAVGLWPRAPEDLHTDFKESIRLRPILLGKEPHPYDSLDIAVDRLLKSNHTLSREAATLLVQRATKPVGPNGAVVFRHDIRLRIPPMFVWDNAEVEFFLKQIQCPFLCIYSNPGKHFENFEKRFEFLRFGHKLVVADASHHLHLEVPHLIIDAILKFITEKDFVQRCL